MTICCPKHNLDLEIEEKTFSIQNNLFCVTVGTCPKCTSKYINRKIFSGIPVFVFDGIRYEFLQSLKEEFPFDFEKQKLLQSQRDAERKKLEEQQKQAKSSRISIKEKKEKAEAVAAEKKRKRQDRLLSLSAKLTKDPYITYFPKFIENTDESLPDVCPVHKIKLITLYNIQVGEADGRFGRACILCERAFLQKSTVTPQMFDADIGINKVTSNKRSEHNEPLILPRKIRKIPQSTVLTATIVSKNDTSIGMIAIIAEEKEQNTAAGIYWIGRSLPTQIIAALVLKTDNTFRYKGQSYRIAQHTKLRNANKYFEIISRFCNSDVPQPIYVFAQKNIARFEKDKYECVTAIIPCANIRYPVPLTVYYEKDTKRYFINESTYLLAREKYGLPYLRLRTDARVSGSGRYATFRQNSELYLLGYSVSTVDGLDANSRRKLLAKIIDSKILPKHDIINHLEWLISSRSGMNNMDNAVSEWKADLLFVSKYNMNEQRSIWAHSFKKGK